MYIYFLTFKLGFCPELMCFCFLARLLLLLHVFFSSVVRRFKKPNFNINIRNHCVDTKDLSFLIYQRDTGWEGSKIISDETNDMVKNVSK